MAQDLARIYGTEDDKKNCPFYLKIGACRHGDRCSRVHNKPLISQTLLVPHLYVAPPQDPTTGQYFVSEEEFYTDFCEDVLREFSKHGDLEEFHVVSNLGDHMIGNLYVKYANEIDASKSQQQINDRIFEGRRITAEFSPVSEFKDSRCRQYDDNTCTRGDTCNFMHLRPLPSVIRRELYRIRDENSSRRRYKRSRSRSPRSRSRSRDRERDRDRDRDRNRDRDRRSSDFTTVRSSSEERRAKIEEWNRAREAQKAT